MTTRRASYKVAPVSSDADDERKNMATEPTFDERDIEDDLMHDLPEGGETLPATKEVQESVEAFLEMFDRAWIH